MKTQLDSPKHAPHALVLFLTVLLAILTAAVSAQAQNAVSPDRGFKGAASYNISDIETINTTNGNLMLRVPVGALPAGRAGTSAGVSLIYNSKLWDSSCDGTAVASNQQIVTLNGVKPSQRGGWRYALGYSLELHNLAEGSCPGGECPPPTQGQQWKLLLVFPDGSHHIMYPQGYDALDGYTVVKPDGTVDPLCGNQSTITSTLTYYSIDGTFVRLDIQHDSDSNPNNNPYTIYLSDGGRVTGGPGPQRIYDRNNNFVEIQNIIYNTHSSTRLIDQLGRSVIVEYDAHPNEDVVHATGFNNQELLTTIRWKTIRVYKDYDSGSPSGLCLCSQFVLDASLRVVDRITLPAQSGSPQYLFVYNATATNPFPSYGWGEVSSVTLPSGARADYSYANDGINGWSNIRSEDIVYNRPTRKDLTYLLEYDGAVKSRTDTWQYSIDSFSGMSETIAPDGGSTTEVFGPPARGGDGVVVKSDSPHVTIERIWKENLPFGIVPEHVGININPYLKTEFTSVKDATGTPVKTSIKDFTRDKNGNVTSVVEYDWVSYASVPRSGLTGLPTGIPTGAILKRTVNTYYSPTPDASDNTTDDPDVYHRSTAPSVRSAFESNEIRNQADQVVARREFFYDNATTTGNLTQQKDWDSAKGAVTRPLTASNSISISRQYDTFGNNTLTIDPRGFQTQFVFGPINGFTDLYVTQRVDALGTSVQRTTNLDYDFSTGLITLGTDADNNISTKTSYDAFGRPTLIQQAYLTAIETRTVVEYSDLARRVITRSDLSATGDGKVVSIQHYDQLGRIRLSRQLENSLTQNATDETTGVKVQRRYSNTATNSFELTSNPYRATTSSGAGAEDTMGWSRTKTDNGGHVIEMQSFSGSGLPHPWGSSSSTTGTVIISHDGNYTTVTDQAGKVRRSVTDGLGRLARVDEPNTSGDLGTVTAPTQPTSYSYDALANLTQVQQGTQSRSFVYDSLSQLRQATNPENGTINYTYYDGGNVQTRTDTRGVVTTFAFDGLNRPMTRTYSGPAPGGSTPAVTFSYDNPSVTNSRGRLTAVSSSVSSYNYGAYDAMGRPLTGTQTTDGQNYAMSYQFNLAGTMVSETYPSGKVVATEYDPAGRMAGVKNQASGLYYAGATATDTANRVQYAAHGGIKTMKLGNGLVENTTFNGRLQETSKKLGVTTNPSSIVQLDYAYGTTSNNGNVLSQNITIQVPGSNSSSYFQSYTYDSLNRLSSATETELGANNWQQIYDYDRYGNRAVRVGSYIQNPLLTPQSSSSTDFSAFNQANNRIALSGFGYDGPAGNLASDPTTGPNAMVYDADNKMISYTKVGATTSYNYDGEGHRVKKGDLTGSTVFVYDAYGRMLAEYTSGNQPGGGTSYLTTDPLGSNRVVTDQAGAVRGRHDYLPFGEEIPSTISGRATIVGYAATDTVRQKFTGYERDGESGYDFTGSRGYSSQSGRFASADPLASADLCVPQSWNSYAYCVNSPLVYIDPSGLIWLQSNGDYSEYKWVPDEEYQQNQDQYKDWTPVETGTIIHVAWVGPDLSQYANLVGGDAILDENGTLTPVEPLRLSTDSGDSPFLFAGLDSWSPPWPRNSHPWDRMGEPPERIVNPKVPTLDGKPIEWSPNTNVRPGVGKPFIPPETPGGGQPGPTGVRLPYPTNGTWKQKLSWRAGWIGQAFSSLFHGGVTLPSLPIILTPEALQKELYGSSRYSPNEKL